LPALTATARRFRRRGDSIPIGHRHGRPSWLRARLSAERRSSGYAGRDEPLRKERGPPSGTTGTTIVRTGEWGALTAARGRGAPRVPGTGTSRRAGEPRWRIDSEKAISCLRRGSRPRDPDRGRSRGAIAPTRRTTSTAGADVTYARRARRDSRRSLQRGL